MKPVKPRGRWVFRGPRVLQMTNCCGIGVLTGFDQLFQWNWVTTTLPIHPNYGWREYPRDPEFTRKVTKAELVKRLAKWKPRGYRTYYANIIDNTEIGKTMIEILKDKGWKEEHTTKSNHGNYLIHTLSIQTDRK